MNSEQTPAARSSRDFTRLVESYACECPGQAELKRRFLDFITHAADPCSRTNFTPGHLTASTVVIDSTLKDILLVHHSILRRWIQPGGHVEEGDRSLAHAAIRELREETGVVAGVSDAILFDLDIHPAGERKAEPAHFHFDVRFLIVTKQRDVICESDDMDVRWFPLVQAHVEADMDRLRKKALEYAERSRLK